MIRILRDQLTYEFSPGLVPVASISSGDKVVFETYDTSTRRLNKPQDLAEFVRVRDPKKVNPAAGPVFVTGAEAGDELIVEVLDIQLAPQGWVRVLQGAGVLRTGIEANAIVFVQVDGNDLIFGDRLRFPARPMIGVIGTSPASGVIYTLEPGPQGSNIDLNAITIGAFVHLPVAVPGALLAIGDVHASMGDGEVGGTGVEISAEVTVAVELVKENGSNRLWIETADSWISSGQGQTLDAAVEMAVEELCGILMTRLGLSRTDAFLLISARGDVRVGQCARIPGLDATAYASFPRLSH